MKVIQSKYTWLTMTVLASIAVWYYTCTRVSHYFIDRDSFQGASLTLLALMLAAFVLSFAVLLRREKCKPKSLKICFWVTAVLLVISIAFDIVYSALAWEMLDDIFYYVRSSIGWVLLIWFGIIALVFLPRLRAQHRKIVSIVLGACLLVSIVFIGFEPFAFRFSANPLVLVRNETTYSVVWATSHPATASLEIVSGGKSTVLYDEQGGNIRANDRVHHITVPCEVLNHCESYTVHSTRVKERTGYSLRTGKSISYQVDAFHAPEENSENLNLLTLTDWHEHAGYAAKAIEHLEQADVLIMAGDALNMINDQEGLITHLLAPCADYSASAMPVIFAKGNHECRGAYSTSLLEDLGMESFYYAYRVGPLSGVVLDMGEGASDDFVEYWSLADYEAYRDTQAQWLEGVKVQDTKYHLSFCHDERFSEPAEGRRERGEYVEQLNRLKTDLLVAGHLHDSVYRPKGENGRQFASFIAGGITKDKGFRAGMVSIHGEQVSLKIVDREGTVHLEESFKIGA
ncbi:MAG: metallophosphoesterase [Clostridia bacterium]|nr:metallophosphoesterase [Clostridia bacterium]